MTILSKITSTIKSLRLRLAMALFPKKERLSIIVALNLLNQIHRQHGSNASKRVLEIFNGTDKANFRDYLH